MALCSISKILFALGLISSCEHGGKEILKNELPRQSDTRDSQIEPFNYTSSYFTVCQGLHRIGI